MTPEEEWEHEKWCHVYGQYAWHSDAFIDGTREALTEIRDAIDAALRSGMDGTAHLFVTDGEGYQLKIRVRDYKHLSESEAPYLAPHAGGIGQRLHGDEIESQKKLAKMVKDHEERRKANASNPDRPGEQDGH